MPNMSIENLITINNFKFDLVIHGDMLRLRQRRRKSWGSTEHEIQIMNTIPFKLSIQISDFYFNINNFDNFYNLDFDFISTSKKRIGKMKCQ